MTRPQLLSEPAERWAASANRHIDLSDSGIFPYHRTVAEIVVGLVAGRAMPRVLDLGCGLGQTASLIAAAAPQTKIELADGSEECLLQALGRVPGARGHRVDIESADSEALHGLLTELAPVDVVVMSHVLEHCRDPRGVLETIAAAIDPSTVLVIAVPNPIRPDVLAKSALRRHYANRGHYYAWDRSHFLVFLERQCGLTVDRVTADLVPLVSARMRTRFPGVARAETMAARALPWFSLSHIAVVRRPAS